MKDFFGRMNDRMRMFMVGRYGGDSLSRFLLIAALVCFLLSLFTGFPLFYIVAVASLVYAYYRILSRNFVARQRENRWYEEKTAGIRRVLRVQKRRISERRDYSYFKCPGCGQNVRVPKGKGHIMITCPKCRTQFDRTV